jgi:hypothetical protein
LPEIDHSAPRESTTANLRDAADRLSQSTPSRRPFLLRPKRHSQIEFCIGIAAGRKGADGNPAPTSCDQLVDGETPRAVVISMFNSPPMRSARREAAG